jgi:hypothetical protein
LQIYDALKLAGKRPFEKFINDMTIEDLHAQSDEAFDLAWTNENSSYVIEHLSEVVDFKNCPKFKTSLT